MDSKKFSRKPANVEDFMGEAGRPLDIDSPARQDSLRPPAPWDAGRPDVAKAFNLRLSEPHLLMLRYIAEHTPDSMQTFCLKALLPAIEAKIAELNG